LISGYFHIVSFIISINYFPDRYFAATDRSNFSKLQIFANVLLGLALGYATDMAHFFIPKTNETVFYSLEFLLNIAFPYAVIALAPYSIMMICGGRKEKSA
jgi:glucose-6-phosphatase